MSWHDDPALRQRLGDQAERAFIEQVRCYCGGTFLFVGDMKVGYFDFSCAACGQQVEVKSSPQAEQTGNLAVSAIPWSNYPDEMLLCACIQGVWVGEYKHAIQPQNVQPYKPTHDSKQTHLGNMEFYLISWRRFRKLTELGYRVSLEGTQKTGG